MGEQVIALAFGTDDPGAVNAALEIEWTGATSASCYEFSLASVTMPGPWYIILNLEFADLIQVDGFMARMSADYPVLRYETEDHFTFSMALRKQMAAGGERADIDHMIEIPIDLARAITGFMHDLHEIPAVYQELEII